MTSIAKTIKDQTDSILRRRQAAPGSSMTVQGGTTQPGTGPGTAPVIVDPNNDLAAHKTSGDHDGRYYTEAESDARYALFDHEAFDNTDTIVVTHNMGRWPVVQVVGQVVTAYGAGNYGAGVYGGIDNTANVVLTPSSIAHNSINQVTVTLSAAATGEVICVG